MLHCANFDSILVRVKIKKRLRGSVLFSSVINFLLQILILTALWGLKLLFDFHRIKLYYIRENIL